MLSCQEYGHKLEKTPNTSSGVRKPATRTHLRHSESESGYEDSIFSNCSESEVEVSTESEYEDGACAHHYPAKLEGVNGATERNTGDLGIPSISPLFIRGLLHKLNP